MKCRYVIDVEEPRKQFWDDERIVIRENGQHVWPVGTVEDHPRAYRLVRNGVAEPADDECRLMAAMSSSDMAKAQRNQVPFGKGIQPEDYQRFFDGEILGYDVDGNDIPGPNWKDEEDDDDDDE